MNVRWIPFGQTAGVVIQVQHWSMKLGQLRFRVVGTKREVSDLVTRMEPAQQHGDLITDVVVMKHARITCVVSESETADYSVAEFLVEE